jgi:hypothetical protein
MHSNSFRTMMIPAAIREPPSANIRGVNITPIREPPKKRDNTPAMRKNKPKKSKVTHNAIPITITSFCTLIFPSQFVVFYIYSI